MNRRASLILWMVVLVFVRGIAAERAPNKPLLVIQGPRIVAFFSLDPKDAGPGDNESLSDFQFYVGNLRAPLKKDGIDIDEVYSKSFRVRVGRKTTLFHPRKITVGYYFVAPGKRPLIEYGVMTDSDLLQVAKEYFAPSTRGN